MKKIFWLLFVIIFLVLLIKPDLGLAQKNSTEINFFYSTTCPHCKKEKEFLNELKNKYSEIEIKEYEVINDRENQEILKSFYEKYQVPEREQGYVPVTFTPTKYFIGFNDEIGNEIEGCVKECLLKEKPTAQKIRIPIFGEIDVSKMSLPLITLTLGTLDGFNPCAMWILIVLISILLPLRSRKKIALVGGIFIFAEGLLYFLIMAAWLNVFLAMSYVSLTRILIGIFGISFGIWRVRDFFLWKPGVCKVVDHSKSQEKIIDKMKNALNASTFPLVILGIMALAFGTNLIEFFCSAGFPVIYTRILTLQNLPSWQYYLYLIFYNFFYMIDDFIVFGFAFFTLSRFGFSDKYNRYSTLVAGLLILILGILLIFKPEFLLFG